MDLFFGFQTFARQIEVYGSAISTLSLPKVSDVGLNL
jgi:hypothetical protein